MKKIGFIGLGVIGMPMCNNLLKSGYSVTVWNRTSSKLKEPVSLGVVAVGSPKEVAQKFDIVIIMVGDSPKIEEVVFGSSGVIEGGRPARARARKPKVMPILGNCG